MTTEERTAAHEPDALVLVISYDGAGFAGSQLQAATRTVQGELEQALGALAGRPVRVTLAGRTDSGVHAAGQVGSLADPRPDLTVEAIGRALNAMLPDDLAVVSVARQPAGFHARYDARWREYRYRVWAGAPQPLARHLVWQRRAPLDLDLMAAAARRLQGTHDVAALTGGGEGVPWSERRTRPRGTVRTILRCSCRDIAPWWGERAGRLVEIRVAADAFLPRMVRNIVALLVEIGEGRRQPEWIDVVLAGRDRRLGGGTAPSHGLILWRIGYGEDVPDPDPD